MFVFRESRLFCDAECFEAWKAMHEMADDGSMAEPFKKRKSVIRAALASSG